MDVEHNRLFTIERLTSKPSCLYVKEGRAAEVKRGKQIREQKMEIVRSKEASLHGGELTLSTVGRRTPVFGNEPAPGLP